MFVTQVQFDQLKKRYQDYKYEGFPNLDKGMKNIIESLNEIPGLVTVFCCEGHYPSSSETYGWQDNAQLLVVTKDLKAFEKLYSIYENTSMRLKERAQLTLNHMHLLWPFYTDAELWYPLNELLYKYWDADEAAFEENKQTYLSTLVNVIQSIKENHEIQTQSL